MPSSPLAPHAVTPAELAARLDAERRGVPFVVYLDGAGAQHLFELPAERERLTIGRRPENDVVLEWDTEVSRVHAEIERVGGQWTLLDDGLSRNGSFVNGVRASGRQRLRDGDELTIGETLIVFCAPVAGDSDSTVLRGERPVPELTTMQRKVLLALCRPYRDDAFASPATNRSIADEVFLSVDAVKSHLRALFQAFALDKLPQNEKRARLATEALQQGLVSRREL